MTDPRTSDPDQQDAGTTAATDGSLEGLDVGDGSAGGLSPAGLSLEDMAEHGSGHGVDLPAPAVDDDVVAERADPPAGA